MEQLKQCDKSPKTKRKFCPKRKSSHLPHVYLTYTHVRLCGGFTTRAVVRCGITDTRTGTRTVPGNSRHTGARSQRALTCKARQDALETQDKTRHIEGEPEKGGQKVTKWRGGCREESPRREMTWGPCWWSGDRVRLNIDR
jgi:hypothetical protein